MRTLEPGTAVKLLDCTLRDGGYYTDWDFSSSLAAELLMGLNDAGVDIVELGYRTRQAEGFFGLFKTCSEDLLAELIPDGKSRYAFMIDAKDFLDDDRPALDDLRSLVCPSDESIFSMCRIAAHPASIGPAQGLIEFLADRGYEVTLNVMGIAALDEARFETALANASKAPLDVLYIADSFGSLTPADTAEKLDFVRARYSGKLGVHMHQNGGLALANTLAAIDHGVEYVDATVTGMGRGAGNLPLEQLLLMLYYRYGRTDLDPTAVVPAIRDHLGPMQDVHGWGWDISYMISGLVGIHPSYCQELRAGSRYEIDEVVAILEDIPVSQRSNYRAAELSDAQRRHSEQRRAVRGEVEVEAGPVVTEAHDTVLVLAPGRELGYHADAIRRFATTHQPLVIECNDTGEVAGHQRITVVLNAVRMHELAAGDALDDEQRLIATGLQSVPAALKEQRLVRVPYELRSRRFSAEEPLTVPAYVVGMVALGLALRAKPRVVYLAGFDGFDEPERRAEHAEMEDFWALCRQTAGADGPELVSLLRTKYDLPVRSVYGLI